MQKDDWNDLRVFLAVARAGQIARAAKALLIDPTTVSRRLRQLEQMLGQRLVEHTRDGQVLTPFGEELLIKVERIAEAADDIYQRAGGVAGLGGQIRLSVSEGFGIWFLAPQLPQLARQQPGLTIELAASSGFLSPSKREADIAVMLSRPKAGPLIAKKLADYALMLYASPAYIAAHGEPAEPGELAQGHRLVGYISDLVYAPELNYLSEVHSDLRSTVNSSSISAQLRLIAEGAGIGILPCFIGDQEPHIARVLQGVRITRSFWIVTHKDTHRLAKVRLMRDWLIDRVTAGRGVLLPPVAEAVSAHVALGLAQAGLTDHK